MKRWLSSFRHAADGVLFGLRTQRNMQVHWVSALAVCIVGMALGFAPDERRLLLASMGAVLSAELLNTALEAAVDLAHPEPHPLARVAKDAAAGGVLVLAATTAVLLASVLVEHWALVTPAAVQRSLLFGLPALAGLFALVAHPRPLWAGAGALLCAAGCGILAVLSLIHI